MVIWKYRDAEKYGSFEVVRSDEMLVPSKYVPEDEWVEITGSRGFIWVNRCSGQLLDAPPVVVYRDGETTGYSDMETDWSSSFVAGCSEFADCNRRLQAAAADRRRGEADRAHVPGDRAVGPRAP